MAETRTVPFEERKKHFAKEKLFLANRFGEFLIERIKFFGGNVILLIDAGTTLSPFFKVINNLVTTKHKGGWLDRFVVVTNNLAAGTGWFSQESPELAFKCVLLSGKLLPEYSALVGFEGKITGDLNDILLNLKAYKQIDIIRELRKSKPGVKIISLVTGNWVRIRSDESPFIPLPLARGIGHLRVKTRMIWSADEVYVVAPLGKIFTGFGEQELLDLFERLPLDGDPYRQFRTDDEESMGNRVEEKIKLVSTYRPGDNFILSNSSREIEEIFKNSVRKVSDSSFEDEVKKFEVYRHYTEIPHYMFKFDDVSANKIEQLKEEFPHYYCKKEEFLKAFRISEDNARQLISKLESYREYKKIFEE